jgi:hypothetical protein
MNPKPNTSNTERIGGNLARGDHVEIDETYIGGTHHGRVEPKHLQTYLNEFTFRFNRRFYPFNAFRSLLGIGVNGEGPTYAGLYSGEWKHPTMASHG